MNLAEFKTWLRADSEKYLAILLPDGTRMPAHFHVTEVGHVAKTFVDCGGVIRSSSACVLQTWWSSSRDDGHRLQAGKLADILDRARPVLLADEKVPVEIECEQGAIAQFPVETMVADKDSLTLKLGLKHTDCLAREKCRCGAGGEDGDESEAKYYASIHNGGGSCCG